MNDNVFAIRMKAERQLKGFTQKELSEKCNVSATMISQYENKDKPTYPTLNIIMEISKVLDVSIDYLCGLSEEKQIKKDTLQERKSKEIDTETFLYSMIELLNKTTFAKDYAEHNTMGEILVCGYTKLFDFINDYKGVKTAVLDKDILPQSFDTNMIINGIIEKYKNYSIEELIPFDDLPF